MLGYRRFLWNIEPILLVEVVLRESLFLRTESMHRNMEMINDGAQKQPLLSRAFVDDTRREKRKRESKIIRASPEIRSYRSEKVPSETLENVWDQYEALHSCMPEPASHFNKRTTLSMV